MGRIIDEPALRNRSRVFPDRTAAGKLLGSKLRELAPVRPYVLAIPAGGVPVAVEIARALQAPLEVVVVRKLQIPWDPEAGFGAMNLQGDLILNEELIKRLRLTEAEIQEQIRKTRKNLVERQRLFCGSRPFPNLQGHTAIVVDDGLASGYTMLAALAAVACQQPARTIVAVPTSLLATAEKVAQQVDELVCLNIRSSRPFAVAAAYENWYDVDDAEVLDLLRQHGSGPGTPAAT